MELQQDMAMVLARETARRPVDLFFRYVIFLIMFKPIIWRLAYLRTLWSSKMS